MKKIVLLFILVCSTILCLADDKQFVKFESSEVSIGKTKAGADLKGITYNTSLRIQKWEVDTAKQLLILVLKSKKTNLNGYFGVFDLKSRQPVWFKRIVNGNFSFTITQDYIINHLTARSICYKKSNGDKAWSSDRFLTIFNERHKLFLSTTGEAIDMNTGKVKWKTTIDTKYGWPQIASLDSNNLLIAASGINKIDLRNGTYAWYKTPTGSTNYTRMAITNSVGIAVGALTGTFFFSTSPDVLINACSNIVVENDRIYFASMKHLSCLDKNCNKIWSVDLPEHSGTAEIKVVGENVYVVNYGYATQSGRTVSMDDAYIAAFGKENGKQKYMTIPDIGGIAYDVFRNGDTVTMVGSKTAVRYNLSTNSLLAKIDIDKEKLPLRQFVNTSGWYEADEQGQYMSLPHRYPADMFGYNKENNLVHLDLKFNYIETVSQDKYAFYIAHGKKWLLLKDSEGKALLIEDGIQVSKFNTENPDIIDGYLYDVRDNGFTIADMRSYL